MAEQPIARQEPVAEERSIASVATVPPAAERGVDDPSLATAGSADLEESEVTGEVASQEDTLSTADASEASDEEDAVAVDDTAVLSD